MKRAIPERYVNVLWLLILGTLWGSSYLFIKITVAEVPALTLVSGRLVVAAIVMWGVLRILGIPWPRDGKAWRSYILLGLFGAAAPYTLITWGEQYIPSGLASLLQSTTPIFALLLALVWTSDERITLAKMGGVFLGFLGVLLLMFHDLRAGLADDGTRSSLLGQLAVVGSSLCYAWTAIYARRHVQGQHPLVSATGQLTMGALFTLLAALLTGSSFRLSLSPQVWASWAGLVVLGTVLAYGIYFALIQREGATFATTVTYVIPVNGLLLGALVLGEPLSPTVLVSLGLILCSILLVRGKSRDAHPQSSMAQVE
jgi:drug/metabolite transporter (DMT)-like permease